jgi:hypothetical protein
MKNQITAFLLLFLFTIATFNKVVISTLFAYNQAYITAVFCVNKAKPALKCNGKCHLNKQFKAADGTTDTKNPMPSITSFVEIFPLAAILIAYHSTQLYERLSKPLCTKIKPIFEEAFYSFSFPNAVFRPPNAAFFAFR